MDLTQHITTNISLDSKPFFELLALPGRGPPRTLSEKEIDRLMVVLGYVFQTTEMAQKCVDEHDVDQKRDLQTVCQEAREIMVTVDCIQIAIWRLNPDRLCQTIKGRVRHNPYKEPIDNTMTTTVKDVSDQAMTLIALMSEKIEALRAASRTSSKAEVYELMGGQDPEHMLLDVLMRTTEVIFQVDEMLFALWEL
ncbi:hypothetical protein FMUND_14484 [Fusarium mundagurra]|uniref:Uncharacterized protein n=1 Tax=Fusarium mundagurra TaxID=1567541 RepID=A0A8H5XV22_9HYPO|nr:hypothetical protein FMUND_14484 [Fusarium mundagurra]